MRAAVVVLVDEGVEQGLEFGEGGRLVGWARSHFFIVCWNRSTLPQVVGWSGREFFWTMCEAPQFVLEGVAAAAAAGESGGEDHAVVGQRGGRDPVLVSGCRKVASTIGPVTRGWAVTCRA